MAHEGIDIDDLLDDLNALGTPTPAKGKANSGFPTTQHAPSGPHSTHAPHHNNSSFHPTGNNYSNQNANNNRQQSSGNGSPNSGSSYQPHPPNKKSPAQMNPKNKFAVMPGEGSRNTSPNSSTNTNSNPFAGQGNSQSPGDDLDSLLNMIEQTNISPDKDKATTHNNNTVFTSPFKSNFITSGPSGGQSSHQTLQFSPELAKSTSQQFYANHGVATQLATPAHSSSNSHHSGHHSNHHHPKGPRKQSQHHQEHDDDDVLGDLDDDDWDGPSHHTNNHKGSGGGVFPSSSSANTGGGSTFTPLTMPQSTSSFKSFSNYPSTGNSSSNSRSSSSTPTMPALSANSNIGPNGSTKQTGSKSRCTRVVLAGCDAQRGLKVSAFSKVACDCLLCSQCNFKVLYFLHASWDKSVDYMFVRNNMPNVDKLKDKLIQHSMSANPDAYNNVAYCCQCQWTTVNQDRSLVPGNSSDPQWICTGHS